MNLITVVEPDSVFPRPTMVAAPAKDAFAKRLGISLRTKAVLSFAVLVVYIAAIGLYVAHDRAKLLHIVQQLEVVHDSQELLARVNAIVAHIVVESQYLVDSSDANSLWEDLELDVTSIKPKLDLLRTSHPEIGQEIDRLGRNAADLRTGKSQEKLIRLRDSTQELNEQLMRIESGVEAKVALLTRQYSELNQSGTWTVVTMGILGVLLFGAAATFFVARLASDIQKLETRAVAIVEGYRGDDLAVSRTDEVGSLMAAVNRMQSDLRRSERRQAISWQQRFHQERLAVVGSLASAVAHEVGNPISSISGISQVTIEAIRNDRRPDDKTLCDRSELIVKQAERIGFVVRQIADFSAPHSPEPELLDANELVRTTCTFVRYDSRFKGIEVVLDLAPPEHLPALYAVSDHVTQVLMNLMINAADATDGIRNRAPTVRVSTCEHNGEFILSVTDNGNGMTGDVLSRAFEESFTTKPASRGRGIGLYLCKMLIEDMGGRIELNSTPGVGTTATTRLPLGRVPATFA